MRRTISRTNGKVVCRENDIYYLDIPAQQSVMTRHGADLVMDFPGGDKLTFSGFYGKKVSFILDEQIISTEDFFKALSLEHLIPAEGSAPKPAESPQNGSHTHNWETMDALDGIWHLNGLDISFEHSRDPQEVRHDNYGEKPGSPAIPAPIIPEDPYVDDIADEAHLDRPVEIHIPENTELVSIICDGPGRVEQLPDGTWVYYPEPIDSGDIPGRNEVPGGKVIITIKWPDGTEHEYEIPITIRDDVPEAQDDLAETKGPVSGNVLDNDDFGVDGPHPDNPIVWPKTDGEHGKLIVDEKGNWTYQPDPGFKMPVGETFTEIFEYIIKDADGDESEAYLKITILGTDNLVSVVPEHPVDPDPDIPVIPNDPEYPVEIPPGVNLSVVTAQEKDLESGPVKVSGTLIVRAPDGAAEIIINGETVWKDGEIIRPEIPTDEGKLLIEKFDPETGRLEYFFILEKPTSEHEKPGEDMISEGIDRHKNHSQFRMGLSRFQLHCHCTCPLLNRTLSFPGGAIQYTW